jgi:hypothetical protein
MKKYKDMVGDQAKEFDAESALQANDPDFKGCKIIVKSEQEKKQFLAMCKYLHDFSVFFEPGSKISILNDMSKKVVPLKTKKICGVSLDWSDYPFLSFLTYLQDGADKNFIDKYIIVKK